MHTMQKISADVLCVNAALLGCSPGGVTLTIRRLPPTSKADTHRVTPAVTMQAVKRADASVRSYRSTEYRMYSSFMSTLREMQQDSYTHQQLHHQQAHQVHRHQQQHLQPVHQGLQQQGHQQQQQQQEALASLREAWRRVSPAVEELMSSVAPEAPAPASPEASALSLPW